jgi:hypothetical protein
MGSNEVVTAKVQGIGRMMGTGVMSYVGANLYSTSYPGRRAFLNGMIEVFEPEVDKENNHTGKTLECSYILE